MAAYTNAELTKSENARFEESFTDIKRRNKILALSPNERRIQLAKS